MNNRTSLYIPLYIFESVIKYLENLNGIKITYIFGQHTYLASNLTNYVLINFI